MNSEEAQLLLPIVKALAEGKEIQFRTIGNVGWFKASSPAFDISRYEYRVKPECQLRPWKLEEIPIGAIARRRNPSLNQTPQVIIAADYLSINTPTSTPCAIMHFEGKENTTAELLLSKWEWKYPNSGFWQHCGMMDTQ